MDRHKSAILLVALHASWFLGNLQARGTSASERKPGQPDVAIKSGALKVTNAIVEFRCEIENNTRQDIWVHGASPDEYMEHVRRKNAGVFLDTANRTIVILKRGRLPDPVPIYAWGSARYTRLPAGQSRPVALFVHLPIARDQGGVYGFFRADQEGIENVTHLAFEIGYYTSSDLDSLREHLLGYQHIDFDESGNRVTITDATTGGVIKAERAVRTTIDGVYIRFREWLRCDYRESRRTPLPALQNLFYGFTLGAEAYGYAQRLFSFDESLFDGTARQIADLYVQVAEGKLNPAGLIYRVDNVLGAGDRERLLQELQEKQAAADQQEQARIAELLTEAEGLDNPAEGRQALALLRQVLAINPSHGEALDLMQKIGAYYQGETMTNSLGMQLVWIPPGQFLMGKKDRPFRAPLHRVRISRGFRMGVYEVTQAQYEAVMGKNPGYPKGNTLPVDHVSWHDATEFCQKLSHKEGRTYRLPTEAEWEYACRAGTQTDYGWGDTPEADPNKANGLGLFNMHDGAAEWCQDWYSDAYYVIAPQMDPQGPQQPGDAPARVFRGYPRSDAPGERCPCFARGRKPPEETLRGLGFRVVLADD